MTAIEAANKIAAERALWHDIVGARDAIKAAAAKVAVVLEHDGISAKDRYAMQTLLMSLRGNWRWLDSLLPDGDQ